MSYYKRKVASSDKNYASKSGVKTGKYINKQNSERIYISAYKYTKRWGLVRIFAVPFTDFETKNPKYHKWLVTVSTQISHVKVSALYNVDKKVLLVPDLKMYISVSGRFVAYYTNKK